MGSIDADFVIGADGATSITARTAGLVDASRVLWGFAVRGYIEADVALPVIALWNEQPRRGFPGYGWLFPGPDGANLGLGLRAGPQPASRGTVHSSNSTRSARIWCGSACLNRSPAQPDAQLGGWLKMGLVGTRPAAGKVLLVGDAAGLVNPLQGRGDRPSSGERPGRGFGDLEPARRRG